MKALSYSSIKEFAKSPNHYLAYINGEKKQTDAMISGSAFDCLLLTPEKFDENFAVAPKVDRRTKEGKAVYTEFTSLNEGKTIIDSDVLDNITKMKEAVMGSEFAGAIKGDVQVELKGDINFLPFKGFADVIGSSVVDVKTTSDASIEGFSRQIANLSYHIQVAVYLELSGMSEFHWLAVESSPPYNVQLYKASDKLIEAGYNKLNALCRSFREWDGNPRGYFGGVMSIELPPWVK